MPRIDRPDGRSARRLAFVLTPFLADLALAAIIAHLEPPQRALDRQVYTIAPGTAARVRAGESITDILPPRLETAVGVELAVRNDDEASHTFGPFVLAPGQSWTRRFAVPGSYAMSCSLYPAGDLEIEVAPAAQSGSMSVAVHRLTAGVWLAACVAVAAGVAIAFGGRSWARAGARGSRRRLTDLAAGLASGAAAVVLLDALALSRIVPWRETLASRALPWWILLVTAAGAAAVLLDLETTYVSLARPLRLGALVALGVAAGAVFGSTLGSAAWLLGLAAIGAAVVVGTSAMTVRGYPVARDASCGGITPADGPDQAHDSARD